MLRDSDALIYAEHIVKHELDGAENNDLVQVRVLWGVSGVDRAKKSRFLPREAGAPMLNGTLDLKPAAAQPHFLRTCRALRGNATLAAAKRAPRARVRCWMEDFLAWRAQSNRRGFATYRTDVALLQEVVMFGTHVEEARNHPFLSYLLAHDVMVSPNLSRIVATDIHVTTPVRTDADPRAKRAQIAAWDDAVARLNAAAPRARPPSRRPAPAGRAGRCRWRVRAAKRRPALR